jgi:hypothetical protein
MANKGPASALAVSGMQTNTLLKKKFKVVFKYEY